MTYNKIKVKIVGNDYSVLCKILLELKFLIKNLHLSSSQSYFINGEKHYLSVGSQAKNEWEYAFSSFKEESFHYMNYENFKAFTEIQELCDEFVQLVCIDATTAKEREVIKKGFDLLLKKVNGFHQALQSATKYAENQANLFLNNLESEQVISVQHEYIVHDRSGDKNIRGTSEEYIILITYKI